MLDDLDHRIEVLERRVSEQELALNAQAESIQNIDETPAVTQQYIQQNMLLLGDFDIDRNHYLYASDVVGTGGVDADVSLEMMGWFTSAPDVSVETKGTINAGSPNLTIDDAIFVGGDNGVQIVVEGAGAAGADLITTISGAPGSTTTATLAINAGTNVSHARVRFRLMTLLEDSTDADADANQATNNTLKDAAHSLYGSTIADPDWKKSDGWTRIGSLNWLCQPLKQNLVRPGNMYINSLIYKLDRALDTLESWPITIFAGIWDNTSGQQKFLEGEPITLNATVEGSPSVTSSTTYFVVFYTNWGESIGTAQVTVNAPTTFTNSEYVALSWLQPAGIVRTEIYRKVGAAYSLLNNPYPQQSYLDKGATRSSVSGFPTVDRARPRAIIKTTVHNTAPATTARWILAQLNIAIPKDYDKSKTTGKQWYVFGLADPIDSVDSPTRAILVDKISIDDKLGVFSRSKWDADAVRGISSNPTTGDQGGAGSGGILIDPGDTGHCPTFDVPIKVTENGVTMRVPAIELVDNEDKYNIVNRQGVPVKYKAEISPRPQTIYRLVAGRFVLTASDTEPVATDEAVLYKSLREIVFGDTISTADGLMAVESNLRQVKRRHVVRITLLEGQEKGFEAGGVHVHNEKILPLNGD